MSSPIVKPPVWHRFQGGPLAGVRRLAPADWTEDDVVHAVVPATTRPPVTPLELPGTAALMMPAVEYVTYRTWRVSTFGKPAEPDCIEVIMLVAP